MDQLGHDNNHDIHTQNQKKKGMEKKENRSRNMGHWMFAHQVEATLKLPQNSGRIIMKETARLFLWFRRRGPLERTTFAACGTVLCTTEWWE